jgi:hypothetical protein
VLTRHPLQALFSQRKGMRSTAAAISQSGRAALYFGTQAPVDFDKYLSAWIYPAS